MKMTFATAKLDVQKASQFLRLFTLGQNGFTQKDGLAAIKRLRAKCHRVEDQFIPGPYSREAAYLVASATRRIVAAETRLALLQKR